MESGQTTCMETIFYQHCYDTLTALSNPRVNHTRSWHPLIRSSLISFIFDVALQSATQFLSMITFLSSCSSRGKACDFFCCVLIRFADNEIVAVWQYPIACFDSALPLAASTPWSSEASAEDGFHVHADPRYPNCQVQLLPSLVHGYISCQHV